MQDYGKTSDISDDFRILNLLLETSVLYVSDKN